MNNPKYCGIKKFQSDSEYYFKEGCFITEVSNSIDDETVSIARARVEVGSTTKWHALTNTTERYVIVEGSGVVEIGENPPAEVTTGDVVIIPPEVRQRISNNGNSDLKFFAICSPRFNQQNYIELE